MSLWADGHKKNIGLEGRREDEIFSTEVDEKVLLDLMKDGVVHFIYQKKDRKNRQGEIIKEGDLREAWGTKNSAIANKVFGGPCPPKEVGYTTYFDMEKESWRVFLSTRLKAIWKEVIEPDDFRNNFEGIKSRHAVIQERYNKIHSPAPVETE